MKKCPSNYRRIALPMFVMLAMLIAGGLVFHAQAQESPPSDAQFPGGIAPQGSRWPMQAVTADGAQVTIFQPQLEDFQGDQLTGRAAVAVTPANSQTQVFGALWMQSRVDTDRTNRLVRILDVKVTKTVFPGADPVAEPLLAAAVQQVILSNPATLSLDQLLTMLATINKAKSEAGDLKNDPPVILFRDHPAMKLQYDGDPRLVVAQGTNIFQAINTPFFVALDPDTRLYYLKGAGRWFQANDPLGPFQFTDQIPPGISQLAITNGYQDPQQPITDAQAAALEIVTATSPSELVWTAGEPQMGTIPGTDLLYVTNTDSDLFMSIDNQQVYLLISGRWYTAPSRNGPWAFIAPDQLPDDFKRIPTTSEKGDVLSHIPGTIAANDAVADAEIPQTAAVNRQQFDQPPVEYDGDPNFQPIEGTSLSYAVNTPGAVIRSDASLISQYYCCYNGVWYQCGAPVGPWQICTQVPMEIYAIPPSCPIYSVRYCHIYGYTPDVCYVGYTPGYTGCYVYDGVVVYGTGYRYDAWEGRRNYIPRPATFGFAAHYNTYSGHWGFSFALEFGGSSWVHPQEKFGGRGGEWFGYGGYRPTYGHRDLEIRDTFVRDEIAARPQPAERPAVDTFSRNVYERRHDLRTDVIHEAPRNQPQPRARIDANAQPPRNDVYSDRQGNTYRRTLDGWQQRDNAKNQWQAAQHDVAPREAPRAEAPRAEAPRAEAPRAETPRGQAPNAQPPQPAQSDQVRGGTNTFPHVEPVNPQPRPAAPPAQPARVEPARPPTPEPIPRRGGAGNAPKAPTPAPQPPKEPAKGEPAKEPARATPPPSVPTGDLNKDYHARVAGEQRPQSYHQPSAPAPQPKAPAAQPAPKAPAPQPKAPAAQPAPKAPAPQPNPPAQAPQRPVGRAGGTRGN